MAYFFINTDAQFFDGISPHDTWFESQMAFTGGDLKYGEMLGRFSLEDIILMYVSGKGILGIGKVQELWDRKTFEKGQLVYVGPYLDKEYRIKVDWYHDFRKFPLHHSRLDFLPRSHPLQAVETIREEYTDQVERVIREHSRKVDAII